MGETVLWLSKYDRAYKDNDVVRVILKDYMGDQYIVFRDTYFQGNMTMCISQFKRMVNTVLEKLKELESEE